MTTCVKAVKVRFGKSKFWVCLLVGGSSRRLSPYVRVWPCGYGEGTGSTRRRKRVGRGETGDRVQEVVPEVLGACDCSLTRGHPILNGVEQVLKEKTVMVLRPAQQ